METKSKPPQMEEVLFKLGEQLGRSREEIQPIVKKMKDHWVDSLEIWKRLPAESKKEFKLPLMLELSLDKLASEKEPKEHASVVVPSKEKLREGNAPTQDRQFEFEMKHRSFFCTFGELACELDMDEPLSSLLQQLSPLGGESIVLYHRPIMGETTPGANLNEKELPTSDAEPPTTTTTPTATTITTNIDPQIVDPTTTLTYALVPGSFLKVMDSIYPVKRKIDVQDNCVDKWLEMIGLSKYSNLFARHKVNDYFSLLFLRKPVLHLMGLTSPDHAADVAKIMEAVSKWQQVNEYEFVGQWISMLGYPQYASQFVAQRVSLATICLAFEEESDLDCVGVAKEDRKRILDCFHKYKNLSSVEETFTWLRVNGFQKYSFHFARYNIPFYALPFVNFFIIDEMGVTHDDQMLLDALQELRTSPAYVVKAMAYWLRDLEMERYNLRFAAEAITDLEVLTLLEDRHIDDLIPVGSDSRKMKEALTEMKEFQYHYSATATLLQELGMARYSQLYSLHGVSVSVLPLFSDKQLVSMGITEEADRRKILRAIEKIKSNRPAGSFSWLPEKPAGEESPRAVEKDAPSSPSPATANSKKSKQRERRKRKAQALAALKTQEKELS